MKKIQAFLVISTLFFVASPMANAEGGNIEYAAEQRKCTKLSNNREKIRCLYNNRRVRRYDLRSHVRRNSENMTTANREAFQQQLNRWNKSRSILRGDCKRTLNAFTSTDRQAMGRCMQERTSSLDNRNENATDMLRNIRRSRRNSIKDYRTTRRAFRENALKQEASRKRTFKRRGMIQINRDRYKPDLGTMEDELMSEE